MSKKLTEVEMIFRRETKRFDDVALVAMKPETEDGEMGGGLNPRGEITVKVQCEPGDFHEGLTYRLYGFWHEHPKYGKQFHAKTFVMSTPHSRAGTIRYLMLLPGVGQIIAQKLWDKLAGKAVKVLREDPELASEIVGKSFSATKAQLASSELNTMKAVEDTSIDIMELLGGRGFPQRIGKLLVQEWGNKAAEIVRKNPFRLLAFPGCGFLRCDQLYMDLGLDPARLKRQALCVWHIISQASQQSGSIWFRPEYVARQLTELIGGVRVNPFRAMKCAKRASLIRVRRDEQGNPWLAVAKHADDEAFIAGRVKQWLQEPAAWPNASNLDVSDHQRANAVSALIAAVAVITGGPGTGKTYLAARVIAELLDQYGAGKVAVCAPTGKAAVRITEVMNGYGIAIKATTIHSLLKVESNTRSGGWSFKHNGSNPLKFQFVVVDEASMLDTGLMASLCCACAKGTHLLLIGDTGQLPPVGPGAPLRDLIAAGVPTGELTEIRRNSGQIVHTCHEIRGGVENFAVSPALNPANGHNLIVKPAASGTAAIEQIVRILRNIGALRLHDPIWECQVLVAVNEKSELSRREINCKLQAELNPGGKRADGNPFRVGDKVICLKNGFFKAIDDAPPGFNEVTNEDGGVFIANGEQGEVKHVEPKHSIVQLSAPNRLVRVFQGGEGGSDWDLAYGVSCHKFQGSEIPIVLVALDEYPGAKMICDRSWLYTAISRAKVACLLVGKLSTAHAMVGRQSITLRKTFLVEEVMNGIRS